MMYRDEREALRDEVMQLKRELERAKSDQERLAQLEKLLEVANREVAALRGQMGDGSSARRPGSMPVVIAVGAVIFFAALGAGLFLSMRARPAPTPTPAPPQAATETTATIDPTPTAPAPKPAPTPAVVPSPPVAAKPSKSVHAIWHGAVTKSQGQPLAAGAPCTFEGTVVSDATGTGVDDVVVTCGGKKLYDDHDELEGMSDNDSDTKQFGGEKPGTWTYALIFSDVGARGPSKNQIAVDSTKSIGKVWSDNLPDFRVDFSIKTKSDPVGVEIEDQ
jgi:hypothetical protein